MTPLDLANRKIRALEATIEDLKAELRDARQDIKIERAAEIEGALRLRGSLPPQCAFILAHLYLTRRVLTADAILAILPGKDHTESRGPTMVKTLIHRIRRRIGNGMLDSGGGGYAISLAGIQAVEAALSGQNIRVEGAQRPATDLGRKLTPKQIRAIRLSEETDYFLGAIWGVAPNSIHRIKNFETYKDVF